MQVFFFNFPFIKVLIHLPLLPNSEASTRPLIKSGRPSNSMMWMEIAQFPGEKNVVITKPGSKYPDFVSANENHMPKTGKNDSKNANLVCC